MTLLRDLVCWANDHLANPGPYKPALSAVKGFRNGAIYGAKIRAPHALVMTFLFRDGSLTEKFQIIARATVNHSRNLAFFVFTYKSLKALLAWARSTQHPLHSFVSGFVAGYVVFHRKTAISNQIILYLLSRIIVALVNVALKRKEFGALRDAHTFPWVAATIWGIVMVLFEYERDSLQDSLVASMTYLYEDSDSWNSLRNFAWHNK